MAEIRIKKQHQPIGLTVNEFFYHDAATKSLKQLKQKVHRIENEERSYEKKGFDVDEIVHFLLNDYDEIMLLAVTVEIYCFLAVEAYINGYGVKLMGENIFNNTYQRICIFEKLKLLIDKDERVDASNKKKMLELVKIMFERRNKIVHPKAEEINDITNWPQFISDHYFAEKQVSNMKKFFNLVEKFDSSVYLNSGLSA